MSVWGGESQSVDGGRRTTPGSAAPRVRAWGVFCHRTRLGGLHVPGPGPPALPGRESARTVGGVSWCYRGYFVHRLPCRCRFRRFDHAGPVPIGQEQGSRHDCDRLPHADPRNDALLEATPDPFRSPRFLADGRARSAVGADHQGPDGPAVLVGLPGCDVLGRAGAADARLGPLADGRRQRLPAHLASGPADDGGGAPAHSIGGRPGGADGLGTPKKTTKSAIRQGARRSRPYTFRRRRGESGGNRGGPPGRSRPRKGRRTRR